MKGECDTETALMRTADSFMRPPLCILLREIRLAPNGRLFGAPQICLLLEKMWREEMDGRSVGGYQVAGGQLLPLLFGKASFAFLSAVSSVGQPQKQWRRGCERCLRVGPPSPRDSGSRRVEGALGVYAAEDSLRCVITSIYFSFICFKDASRCLCKRNKYISKNSGTKIIISH